MSAPTMAVLLRHNSLTAFLNASQQRRSESVTLETGTPMSRASSCDKTDFTITGSPFPSVTRVAPAGSVHGT
jgi:hypothetical protein